MHRQEEVLLVVEQRDEAVLEVELAGYLVDGIDLDGPDADVLGNVSNPTKGVDKKVFSQSPALDSFVHRQMPE